MRRSALLALALALGLIGLLAACGGEETVTPAPETVVGEVPMPETPELPPGDAAAGKEVFASAGCGACHTLADAGTAATVGPNLDDSKPDLVRVIDRVTNGKGAMPAFKDQLHEQQIADVAVYVVQAAGGAAAPPPPPPAEPPPSAAGDPAAGKEVFNMQGCGACHTFSAAGSSGTIGPNLDTALAADAEKAGQQLEAFAQQSIVDPNAYVAEGFDKGIMPNFGSQLSDKQIADLVAFLTQS